MPDVPLVSVITPTRDQGPFIEQTIRSLKAQRFPSFEHIVVDGGSTDDTLAVLRRHAPSYTLRWLSEPDRGMYDAINKGLVLASGEILAYLNSDDLYFPWSLKTVVRAFEVRPEIDVVYGDAVRMDGRTATVRPWFQPPFDLGQMTASGSLIQPAVFWRRRVLESIGPFDPELRFAGDLDYWLRAGEAGCRFLRLDEILAIDRAHEAASSVTRYDEMADEIIRVRTRHRAGGRPTIVSRARGRARRELWARRLWLRFAAQSRRHDGTRQWAEILDHLARPISIPAALLGSLPGLSKRVQPALRWRSDALTIATETPVDSSMPEQPLVTVVTPSFRHAEWLDETLRSVREQSYPRIEHIVVDGGSDDGTVEILRQAEDTTGLRWISEPDQGQADAINKGVQMAGGDIVTWLNSDDVYVDRDGIAKVVERFRGGSKVVTGAGLRLASDGRVVGRIAVHPHRLDPATIRRVDWILQPSTFYTRELALSLPLDPSLKYAMDWDFFIRLAQKARMDWIDEPIAGYRIHGAGKTVAGGVERQWELLRVLRRHNPPGAWNVRLMGLTLRLYEAGERLPGRLSWIATRLLNALARLTNVATNGRGLPP